MTENYPLATTETQVDRPPRLRVDTAGLSEATRRELGLVELEGAEQSLPTGREGGMSVRRGTPEGRTFREGDHTALPAELRQNTQGQAGADIGAARPTRAFPAEDNQARNRGRMEPGSSPDMLERDIAVGGTANEEERFDQSHGFGTAPVAGNQSDEKQLPEGEGRQWAQGGVEISGEGLAGTEQGREVAEGKAGGESFDEGYNPSLENNSTLLRPGRARSGARRTRPEELPAKACELPEAGLGREATGRREEFERLAELHAAVKQNIAHSQQTHAAVLQALRDSARLHSAQRAELDRLAAQVRRLLGQSENAGFSRQ